MKPTPTNPHQPPPSATPGRLGWRFWRGARGVWRSAMTAGN